MAFRVERFMRTYRLTDTVFRQNVPGAEMFIVYSGKVNILLEGTRDEEPRLLATIGPGQFFGEMALIDGGPRSASAVAAEENTRLLVLDRDRLLVLFRQRPEIGLSMVQTLCQRIRQTNATLEKVTQQLGGGSNGSR